MQHSFHKPINSCINTYGRMFLKTVFLADSNNILSYSLLDNNRCMYYQTILSSQFKVYSPYLKCALSYNNKIDN